jgi:hypothetical protein
MSDESRLDNPHALWQQQPREDTPVIVDHLVNRRTEQLHRSTRAEIVASMAAAIFFVAVLAWLTVALTLYSGLGYAWRHRSVVTTEV